MKRRKFILTMAAIPTVAFLNYPAALYFGLQNPDGTLTATGTQF